MQTFNKNVTSPSSLIDELKQAIGDRDLFKRETVQALWSGYGEIARYHSPQNKSDFIVKHVSLPEDIAHPRGWNTTKGHQRKIQSYHIEACFYREYSDLCDHKCTVPKLITLLSASPIPPIVLEDLDASGFFVRRSELNLEQIKVCLSWLAHFHGRFMHNNGQGLWPVGCYWHLATRQDELGAMKAGPLKASAQSLDASLNQATFQTLVHGDAKLANFCFDETGEKLAAVDFQYVGRGVGVKDVAYFLGSCMTSDELFSNEQSLLAYYFYELKLAVRHYQVHCDIQQLETEWRDLYPIAWADFHRFLTGWSPGHAKMNDYMAHQTEIAVKHI